MKIMENIFTVLLLHFFCVCPGYLGAGVKISFLPPQVIEGEVLTLTCSITENTSVYALFTYEDLTSTVYRRQVEMTSGACINSKTGHFCQEECSCSADGTSYSWTIPNVTRSLDKARISCTVHNPKVSTSNLLILDVRYPPTGPLTMTPSGTYTVSTGTQLSLKCQVNGGNTLATLTWECKGSQLTGQNQNNSTSAVSIVTVRVDKTYHKRQCVCTAGHQASPNGIFGTASMTLNVLYPPDITTFAIVNRVSYYEGDNVYLDCIIEGGNPLASLTWRCIDVSKEMSSSINTQTKAIQRLTISSIHRSYNNRPCTCTVSHTGLLGSLNLSVLVTVYYPPAVPVLSVNTVDGEELPWIERPGFTGVLTCKTTPGNPPSTRVSWYNNGVKEPGQSSTTRIFDPPDKSYNGRIFTCTVENNYTDARGRIAVSNEQRLDIEYEPVITLIETVAYVNESLSFSRRCTAEGNPVPHVAWCFEDSLFLSAESLQFDTTYRNNAGTYSCMATAKSISNNVGLNSTKKFKLIVQYGPVVTVSSTNTTENATEIQLLCSASGVPDHYIFKWTHWVGGTFIRDTFDRLTTTKSFSTITIPRVTYQDMGIYKCDVENGYKGQNGQITQTKKGKLRVTASPRVVEAFKRYVVENETMLDINITYISFPEPVNTSIIKVDGVLAPSNELTITFTCIPLDVLFHSTPVTVDGYKVSLHFNKVEPRHAGAYQLHIRNVFSYTFLFKVVISDKPDLPTHLMVGSITKTSAVVSWVPGDDNGHVQQFTVICQSIDNEVVWNDTVSENDTSLILLDLDESTEYKVSIYSSNIKGVSDPATTVFTTETDSDMLMIGYGSAAVLVLIAAVVIVVIIAYKRKSSNSEIRQDEGEEEEHHYEDVSFLDEPSVSDEAASVSGENDENVAEGRSYECLGELQPPNIYQILNQPDGEISRQQYEGLSSSEIERRSSYEEIPMITTDEEYDDVANRTYEPLRDRTPPNNYDGLGAVNGTRENKE